MAHATTAARPRRLRVGRGRGQAGSERSPPGPMRRRSWRSGPGVPTGRSGDAGRALAAGELVKVFTFRGATHLMTPQDAGAYLAVRASSRMWELPSWQSYYELAPSDWPRFRKYVRRCSGRRAADPFGAGRRARPEQAATGICAPSSPRATTTLLKPLTWQGDMGLGVEPGRRGHVPAPRRRPRLGRHSRPRRGWADARRGVLPHPRSDDPGPGPRLVRQGARGEGAGSHPLAGAAR